MDPRRLLPVLTAATAVVVIATLVALGWRAGPGRTEGPAAASATPSSAGSSTSVAPAAVLARWDARRSRAWAHGDVEELARLYAAGSRAGMADVRLLARYARRGLRVTGLQTQVLGLEVLASDERRLLLRVTDRVVGGQAVGRESPVALPRDRSSTRRIVLVRVGGRWLVDRVSDEPGGRPQPRAAASTSRTSRSSKS